VRLAQYDEVVQTLHAHALHPALRVGRHVRRPRPEEAVVTEAAREALARSKK